MASGGLSCLRGILSLPEILAGVRKANPLSGKLCNFFVRPMSQSNREANNNEPGSTQQENTLKYLSQEHFVGEMGGDKNCRDAMFPMDNVGGEGHNAQSDKSSLVQEQNQMSHSRAEVEETLINNNLARILVDELGYVYARYRENIEVEKILKEQNDDSVPEESRETINKAKELYLNALTAKEDVLENQDEEHPIIGDGSGVKLGNDETAPRNSKSNYDFLGIKTVYGDLIRPFSTSARRFEKKGTDCDKAKKLPCLQSSELSTGMPKAPVSSKGVCERFCMPCCKPAREPPICFYPYNKAKCIKKRPPRPAFSECKTIFDLKAVRPCECIRPLVGSCKKAKESAKCAK